MCIARKRLCDLNTVYLLYELVYFLILMYLDFHQLLLLCGTVQEEDQICYDLKYALRLCAEHGHKRACVHVYSIMGLYDEAVELALQVVIHFFHLF
jgi:hypothetical protein